MKICICGKGGSGKSTVVALLAAAFRDRGKSVLVVDSDESSACLHWMLGFDQMPAALIELAGDKKRIQQALLKSKLTGAIESRDIPVLGEIPFSQEFVRSALEGTAIEANPAEVRSLVDSLLSVLL